MTKIKTIVSELINLQNSDEYSVAKDLMKRRKDLREMLRERLANKEELPSNSKDYAGLVKIEGRVSWKSVAEALAEEYKVPVTKVEQIVEEYRSNSCRLDYGKIDDLSERRQLKFEFVTPSYLGDEVK